jgi:hypothetical protein
MDCSRTLEQIHSVAAPPAIAIPSSKRRENFDRAPGFRVGADRRRKVKGRNRRSEGALFWFGGLRVSLVLALCLMMGLSTSIFPVHQLPGPMATAIEEPSTLAQPSTSQRMISEAESSLKDGQGPAYGSSVACGGSDSGLSCSSVSKLPISGVQATSVSPTFPQYTTPSSRYGAPWTMVPTGNTETDFLLLFGGANSTGIVFNDTWAFVYNIPLDTGGNWVNESKPSCDVDPNPCPAARHDESLVWDSNDGYVLMFGGCGAPTVSWTQSTPGCPASEVYGDTWKWVPSTTVVGQGVWSQITVGGVLCGGPGQPACSSSLSPSPRYAAGIAAVYEGEVILFGGCGSSSCPLGDTWSFQGGIWAELSPSKSPSVRYGAAMTYDLHDSVALLFGGCGTSAIGCSVAALYGDTWEFNPSTQDWAQIRVQTVDCGGPSQPMCAAGAAPTDRYFAMISCPLTSFYPSQIDDASLAGGTTGGVASTVLSDYWHFSGTSWFSLPYPWVSGPGPAPRFDGDWLDRLATLDDYQMFGGTSLSGSTLGDTYWQDPYLTQLAGPRLWPPVTPSPRASFSMAYDGATQEVVVFGGCELLCPANETWVYGICGGTTILQIRCPATQSKEMVWVNETNFRAAPPARTNASMGYDYTDHELVLFGGVGTAGSVLDDTWTFYSGAWSQVSPSTPYPPARQDASMASYNGSTTSADGVVLFGGIGGSGGLLSDTWYFSTNVWGQVSGPAPSARSGAALLWDPLDGYILLFGGKTSSALSQQTWKLAGTSMAGLVWASITPTCTASNCPPAEANGGITYDFNDGYVVLFENGDPTCAISSCWSLWSYTFTSGWSKLGAATCLPSCTWPLTSAPIAYTGPGRYVVLFGGWSQNASLEARIFGWGNGKWVADVIANPTPSELAPPPMTGASMGYDPSLAAVILVGGCWGPTCSVGTGASFGTWAFQSGSWHFSPFPSSSVFAPDRVAYASIAFLQPTGPMLLFGGVSYAGLTLSSVTWTLSGSSISSLAWAQYSSGQPSARWGAAMASDSSDSYLVLFGGCSTAPILTNVSICTSLLGDTWTWNGAWTNLGVLSKGPPARFGSSVTSGPAGWGLVLADGYGAHGPISDEWEFVGGSWSKFTSSPAFSARWGASMTYETVESSFVLFGGFELNASGGPVALNDTWTQVPSLTAAWTLEPIRTFTSPPMGFGSLDFDPAAGGDGWCLLYGGMNATSWQEQGSSWYFTTTSDWLSISPWS